MYNDLLIKYLCDVIHLYFRVYTHINSKLTYLCAYVNIIIYGNLCVHACISVCVE